MKLTSNLMLLSIAGFVNTINAAGCNADSARAVTGATTKSDFASRKSDCSSFLLTTVTPKAASTTITSTITVSSTMGTTVKRDSYQVIEQRQATVTPSSVPAYASACSGAPRYSSACSCFGVTASIITAATPTPIITTTVTATVCPKTGNTVCGAACYDLQTSNTNCGSCGNACSSGLQCTSGTCQSQTAAPTNGPSNGSSQTAQCSGPFICNVQENTCDSNNGATCVCYSSISHGNVCSSSTSCNTICASDADCGKNSICLTNTCCNNGNTCSSPGEFDNCVNPSNPAMMLRRGLREDRRQLKQRI